MKIPFRIHLDAFAKLARLPLRIHSIPAGKHVDDCPHDHDFTEIAIVTEGHALHCIGGCQCRISKGDVLVIYRGMVHNYRDVETLGLTNILYRPEELPLPFLDSYELPVFRFFVPTGKVEADPANVVYPIVQLTPERLQEVIARVEQIKEELQRTKPGGNFCAMAIFMTLLVLLGRAGRQGVDNAPPEAYWVSSALAYMRLHFADPLDVEAVASTVHVSSRTFFRYFKESTGYSPHQYQKWLRLQHAAELLLRTSLVIGQVALESGFASSSHLSRDFRQAFHCSPSQFRQQKGMDGKFEK